MDIKRTELQKNQSASENTDKSDQLLPKLGKRTFKRDISSSDSLSSPAVKKRKLEQNSLSENQLVCSSQQISHNLESYKDEVFFIQNEKEKQSILQEYRKDREIGSVIEIFSDECIFQDDLLTKKQYIDENTIEKSPGRLFSDEPILLVFDFTTIDADKIAGLNDLLESPAKFEGTPLSQSVRRLIFVSKKMLTSHYNVPGADFWRRLQTMIPWDKYDSDDAHDITKKLSVKTVNKALSNNELLVSKVSTMHSMRCEDLSEESRKIIDFSQIRMTWTFYLKGGFYLNKEGKIIYQESQLAQLLPGDTVILHDAPWDDEQFVHTLATMIRENGYYSHGRYIQLPENIKFIQTHTSKGELQKLKDRFVNQQNSLGIPLDLSSITVLNKQSLNEILSSTTQINEDGYCSINVIEELLKNCKTLFITNELTDQQWLYLLREIDRSKIQINIIFDEEAIRSLKINENVQYCLYHHQEHALEYYKKQDYFIYQVNLEDEWSELWYKTHFESYHHRQLRREESELLKALKNGKKILLYGLENNSLMLAQLETLLVHPSHIFVQGNKIRLPEVHLTILCQENRKEKIQKTSFLWSKSFDITYDVSMEDQESLSQPAHLLDELFSSLDKHLNDRDYCTYFPWRNRNFASIFKKQVEIEQQLDQSDESLPIHYQRALYTLIVKNYRSNENIYGYLKAHIQKNYADMEEDQANKQALQDWLENHPQVNQLVLKEHFWSLVRHCPIQLFNLSLNYTEIDKKSLDLLSCYLLGSVSVEKRESLAKQLGMDIKDAVEDHHYYDNRRRKCLYDALLISGEKNRKGQQVISILAKGLEKKVSAILSKDISKEEATDAIYQELQNVFSDEILQKDFKDLPSALFYGEKKSQYRQERRLKKLASRVEIHPLIFLQGVAGAGKSYTAQAVVNELRKKEPWKNMPDSMVLSLGPETTKESLYGSEKFEELMNDDKKSDWQPGPILQWAINPNPPLLILDEANLAREGVLAPLSELTLEKPQLSINGNVYEIPNPHLHRIILTGNPNSYSGRGMDSTIQEKLMTFYCRPLSKEVLAQSIIEPSLSLLSKFPMPEKQMIKQKILFLYTQYQQILKDLSPRDLQDVLASLHHTLHYYREDSITEAQINSLVWTSFKETLATSLSEKNRPSLTALEHWFIGHYSQDDSILEGKRRAFDAFCYAIQQSNKNIFIDTHQVRSLIYQYWLFLEKQTQSYQGKKGLLVEGPAGWGKDALLGAVFSQWQQQHHDENPLFLNANVHEWSNHIEKIKQAMIDGQKVIISEMNILPSHHLEGLFNEVLTCPSSNGFALIATMNPSSFSGRKELSVALKNRCQYIILHHLTKKEIKQILTHHFPGSKWHDWFTERYSLLSKKLQKNHSCIQFTRNSLLEVANLLEHNQESEWPKRFEDRYSLALSSLSLTMQEFEKLYDEENDSEYDERMKRQEALSLWINKQQEKPMIVQILPQDSSPSFNKQELSLFLPDMKEEDQLQEMSERVLTFDEKIFEAEEADGYYNITKKQHFHLTQYFKGSTFALSDYRLEVSELDHQLNKRVIPYDEDGITIISPLFDSINDIENKTHYQLGHVCMQLSSKRYNILPGLSSNDTLIAIDCEEKVNLSIARSNKTGQILVKLQEKNSCEYFQKVNINFVIYPDQNSLSLTSHDHSGQVKIDQDLCPSLIRNRLDQDVFSVQALLYESCRQLQEIKKISNKFLQVKQLSSWCNCFSRSKNIIGKKVDHLINIIIVKQGVCRHQASAFYFLCRYFNIFSRIIENDIHSFIEISFDGKEWVKVQILSNSNEDSTSSIEIDHFRLSSNLFKENQHHSNSNDDFTSSIERDHSQLSSNLFNDDLFKGNQYYPSYDQDTLRYTISVCISTFIGLFEQQNSWMHIKRFLSSRHVRNQYIGLTAFSYKLDELLDSGFPIINKLLKMIKDHKILKETDSLKNKEEFKVSVGVILTEIHRLYKKSYILKNDYYNFIKECLIFIDNENIFMLYSILKDVLQEDDGLELEKEKIDLLLKEFYRQFTKQKDLSSFRFITERNECFNLKGKSKTLINSLKKETLENNWSDIPSGKMLNISRFLENRKPFPIHLNHSKQRTVILPHFLNYGSTIYEFLRDFLQSCKKREKRERINGFSQKLKNRLSILSQNNDAICEVVRDFEFYFFEKTQSTLYMVAPYNIACSYHRDHFDDSGYKKIPLGVYSLEKSKLSIRRIITFCARSHINGASSILSEHKNTEYYSMDYIDDIDRSIIQKENEGEPSLIITRDFLIQCFLEYIETLEWSLLGSFKHEMQYFEIL